VSAYMVDRNVIRFILATARHYGVYWQGVSFDHMSDDHIATIGQMLWDENLKSIEYRYPDCVGHPENLPGVIDETYLFGPNDVASFAFGGIDPVQVLKTCDCLEYQSCEHPEWEQSDACKFLTMVRHRAVSALPGYDDAKWGAPASMGRLVRLT